MARLNHSTARIVLSFLGVVFAAISAFFVSYTIRLLVVTRVLNETRRGGQGAYIGAVVFPLLAAGCAWVSWRCFVRAHNLNLANRRG